MKVKYFPCQPHCFAFGGFDMQMINTLNAVINEGVDASKLDIWSRNNDFEILHLWGVGSHNYHIIHWAKKSGKAIIATVLLPYYDTIRSITGYYYRRFLTDEGKKIIHYLGLIDKIVVLNQLQQNVLTEYYKVPASKIAIIPNIIEDKYFEIPTFRFSEKYKIENYVLCTGNISPRKNQYNLAIACINLNLNLVLIGNILDGEITYGKKLEALTAANKNILWLRELPKASDELVSAYYNCSIYALPSKSETQPISALEAVAMKKPLILMDRKYAAQVYYKDAILCKSASVEDITLALKRCITIKNPLKENTKILNCKAEKVGNSYKDCYTKLVNPM